MSVSLFPDQPTASYRPSHGISPPQRSLNTNVWPLSRSGLTLKRCFDVVGSLAILAALSPVLPILAIVIRLDGGPALYRHQRVGLNNASFACLKYRTMAVGAETLLADHLSTNPAAASEWRARRKLTNDPRITKVGAFLRATSLDELPQLLNVVLGNMSLVGPRPVVREELEEHYGDDGRAAYAITRPGITGLWQISGRSDTTYEDRVSLDIRYAQSRSLLLDIKILLRTIPVVLSRRGAV